MKNILFGLAFLIQTSVFCQEYTISGYVKDKNSGEDLIGANIMVKGTTTGTITNTYGFYSLKLEKGTYTLLVKFIGYNPKEFQVDLQSNKTINIELDVKETQLESVTVTGEKSNRNVISSDMGTTQMTGMTVKKVPVLMGEVDLIKTLRLMPGVKSTGELSSGMSIRGGARDQNLLLLDEATVYNASHLGGIFSVFNNDAIKNIELYKGKIPASHGGRLASLIDIRMKDGNMKKYTGSGGIGLISSRLTVEGPIVRDKSSFIVSGRRTYMDAIIKLAGKISENDQIEEFPFHFYDLNLKTNYKINQNNRLYLSGYFGRDVFSFASGDGNDTKFNWGNYTGTIRWNHIFNTRLFSNFTILASNYDYLLKNKMTIGREKKEFAFEFDAFVKDYSAKADFGYYLNKNNTLNFGFATTYHDFNVGSVNGRQDTIAFDFKLPKIYSIESVFYLSNRHKISDNIIAKYGLRYSLFQNIGKATVNIIDENYNITGEKKFKRGEIYHTYHGFDPRVGINYILSKKHAVKAGYSRTRQYLLIASNSRTGNPLDVWICANPNIKPQISDQFSLGYFRNFLEDQLEFSVETYYKNMQNQAVFKAFAQPQFNPDIEEDLRFGKGRAYGLELLLRKKTGRLSGWVGYTLSRSERKIKDIQEKSWYLSPYDSPHDFTIVAMYSISKRTDITANWTFKSGRTLTAPAARYEYGNLILPYYAGRNKDRMPHYHRLDLGVTIKGKEKPGKKLYGEWVFSVYNAYGRKNADAIYFEQDSDNYYKTSAMRTTYFTLFPSVTYNFKF
jgi:hypothetical protein